MVLQISGTSPAAPDLVYVERSDDLYRSDGSLIAAVPVVAVVEFADHKILQWRDYCDDWVMKLGIDVSSVGAQ